MDTSPKYIKMCEKAEEIQKLWRPKLGDFVWGIPDSDGEPTVSVCLSVNYSAYEEFGLIDVAVADLWDEDKEIDFEWWNKEKLVWLPRLDQLKEIYMHELLQRRDIFCCGMQGIRFNSSEQLCLACIIGTKYGKAWDDRKGEWVKPPGQKELK